MKNKPVENIVFYFPSADKAGGVQVLFATLAEYLHMHSNYRISICDYKDGYFRSHLKNYDLQFIEVIKEKTTHIRINNALIIYPVYYIKDFFKYLSVCDGTRVLFWEFGPFSFGGLFSLTTYYRKLGVDKAATVSGLLEARRRRKILNFIQQATNKRAIFFMCNSNAVFTSRLLKCEIASRVIPVAIKVKQDAPLRIKDIGNRIHVAWMSRLVYRKTRPLFLLINDLSRYLKQRPDCEVVMHVIGEGDVKDSIKQELVKKNIAYRFVGRLEDAELKTYIQENVDVAFSMGMSALDFAAFGVPSVFTIGEFLYEDDYRVSNKYKWTFDTNGYDVTSEPSISDPEKLVSINEIFYQLRTDSLLLSQKSYKYVLRNHSVPQVSKMLIKAITESDFHVDDLRQQGLHLVYLEDHIVKAYYNFKKKIKDLVHLYVK